MRLYDRASAAPLDPGEVAEALRFDLLPTSYEFQPGHALRLSISGGDADYFDSPEAATTLSIHRGGARPSVLSLPIAARR